MSHVNANGLQSIDREILNIVSGGDGWDDYKRRIAQDAADTGNRFNKAVYYNKVNGHTDTGKFIDNYVGMLYDGVKTGLDAIPFLGNVLTNLATK